MLFGKNSSGVSEAPVLKFVETGNQLPLPVELLEDLHVLSCLHLPLGDIYQNKQEQAYQVVWTLP